jgi:hypothetical protein
MLIFVGYFVRTWFNLTTLKQGKSYQTNFPSNIMRGNFMSPIETIVFPFLLVRDFISQSFLVMIFFFIALIL